MSIPIAVRLVQKVFLNFPLPGRYLDQTLSNLGIQPEQIETPILCRDRWNCFDIEISNPSDIIQKHILFQGYFEYLESRHIRNLLKCGGSFVDIGANIGWYTLLAADRVGASGRVLAFEPVTVTYNQLLRNIALNKFRQVQTVRCGLADTNRRVEIFPCEDRNSGANSIFSDVGSDPIEIVELCVGDEFLESSGFEHIDVCKIDVEGSEMDVVMGLERSFKERRIANILIEVNSRMLHRAGTSPDELISTIRGYGFDLKEIRSGRRVERFEDMTAGLNLIGQLT